MKLWPLLLIFDGVEDRNGLRNSLLKGNKQSLDSLLLILKRGGFDSRFASARVLKFIVADAESKLLVAKKEGVVVELLKSATLENDPALVEKVSSTREERKEICENAACVTAVLSKVLKVSTMAMEHARFVGLKREVVALRRFEVVAVADANSGSLVAGLWLGFVFWSL
ncbi:hypothetical protein VIGAN_08274500 [Vigna angularis var. angularis]|uniref:U-box domain-containing protein n=1 Tax=Vigna angularis var. angularis TaxID=157739 RepID=A0A0S3SSY1_PHAAN|nr:hypothetical protein VIGAN_08274500 [Vigna angularis var. angularis]